MDKPSPFKTYIALGDSLTAGYADGALSLEGQLHAYPNLIHKQWGLESKFQQPLVLDQAGIGFDGMSPRSRLMAVSKKMDDGSIQIKIQPGPSPDMANLRPIGHLGPYQNMGIPGAKSFHLLLKGYGGAGGNPFFARFASSPETSVLKDALSPLPDFFSLWIGSNDVLAYGISGGEGDPITPADKFEAYLYKILSVLTSNGARGVIATIPDVTLIPFFNTIPIRGLSLDDDALIRQLNQRYAPSQNLFKRGYNPYLIRDKGAVRVISEEEKILLDTPSRLIGKNPDAEAIPERFVLSTDQLDALNAAIIAYNDIIVTMTHRFDLALVDVNQHLCRWPSGLGFNRSKNHVTYSPDGIFSLDGIHLSPKGSAVVANIFIEAINERYRTAIRPTNPESFRGTIDKSLFQQT